MGNIFNIIFLISFLFNYTCFNDEFDVR